MFQRKPLKQTIKTAGGVAAVMKVVLEVVQCNSWLPFISHCTYTFMIHTIRSCQPGYFTETLVSVLRAGY